MSIFHPRKGQPYHEVNSLRGIDRAVALGFDEIDLDMQMTKDGHIVVCHWSRPLLRDGFRDPDGKIARTRQVRDMTLAEVSRLKTKDGYRIQTLNKCLARCAEAGIAARVEPKVKVFYQRWPWENIAKAANGYNVTVRMYALRNHVGDPQFGQKCWGAARGAGIKGKVIH